MAEEVSVQQSRLRIKLWRPKAEAEGVPDCFASGHISQVRRFGGLDVQTLTKVLRQSTFINIKRPRFGGHFFIFAGAMGRLSNFFNYEVNYLLLTILRLSGDNFTKGCAI